MIMAPVGTNSKATPKTGTDFFRFKTPKGTTNASAEELLRYR